MRQATPMKRTAMKAGTKQLKANKPMARCTTPMCQRSNKTPGRTDKIALIAHGKKVRSIFRSAAYLALVRTLPCVCCGIRHITQAAHSNQLIFGKGRGLKASDASAVALCATTQERNGCHANHDQGGKLSKAEWKAFEFQNIVATIMGLIALGKLVGDTKEITTQAPPTGTYDFEMMAMFLVGLVERGELHIGNKAVAA